MKSRSIRFLKRHHNHFCRLRQPRELAALLEVPLYKLQLLAIKPHYHHFSVPKSDGSLRWIEEPDEQLKYVQRKLNQYLQCVYYFHCTDAAYGFMLNARKDPDPRNILTNAQQHLGCQWLFNADLEDFFHAVKWQAVYEVFSQAPFEFEPDLVELLTQLCTHQERLPMGTPTSPVLSNFVCRELDGQLLDLARWAGWTFTRFADDMSFSAQEKIDDGIRDKVEAIVQSHGFRFNPEKIWLYGPDDEKLVTGLRLEEQVKLPKGYAASLMREITKLDHVLEAHAQSGRKSKWVEKFQQQVEGMLNFAAFVMGAQHPIVQEAEERMEAALDVTVPDAFSAMSWMDFSYG
jgi:RNA-directed DNA polymerase